jgi:diguanylate cyclase (GGDEF)-like protein
MIKYFLALTLLFMTGVGSAEETPQQLLERAYEIRNQDKEKFNNLLTVISTKTLSPIQEDFLIYLQARKALISGDDTKAIALAQKSSKSDSVRIAIFSYQLLSNIYNLNFELEQAFNYIFHALALTENYDNNEVIATVYAGAANLYAEIEDYQSAAQFAQQALTTSNSATERCFIYSTVGSGNRKIDKQMLDEGIEACTQAKQTLFIYLLYLNHAEYLLDIDDPLAAYKFIKQHFAEIETLGFDSYTYAARMLIGRSARRIGYLEEAERELNLCLTSSDDDDSTQIALRELGQIYLERKEFEKAAVYLNRLDAISEQVMVNKLKNQLAYQAAKFKNLDRLHQINNLTRTNELNELSARLDDQKIKLLVISIVLISIIALAVIITVYKRSIRFRSESYKDPLTGIGNRRWFDLKLKQLLSSSQKHQSLCLVIMDLDKFKTINDKYGHAAGDLVIQSACKCIKKQIRMLDVFARVGGEEFALILENCELKDAKLSVEKCRASLRQIIFSGDLEEVSISASFGISSNLQANNDAELLFEQADEAMYQSKKNGRNQVTIYNKESIPPELPR